MFFRSYIEGVVITVVPEHDAEGPGVQLLQTTDVGGSGATAGEREVIESLFTGYCDCVILG